jgi:integrase
MPAQKRYKTGTEGVYYIKSKRLGTNKPEKIYYIMYRKDGKQIHEKAGRQHRDDMTPARAAGIRSARIDGIQLSNKEKRAEEKAEKEAEKGKWTIGRLWEEYRSQRIDSKSLRTDANRYKNYIEAKFGAKEPHEIIQLDVDRLRINLLKKRAPQTVKHVLALLNRIINFGKKKGLSKPLNFTIEMPKVHNEKTEDLSPDQLKKLLQAIDKSDNIQAANMMKMALYRGLRRGEMFKLRWSDIDFNRGFINLRDPKGGPDQKVPLNDAARKLLKTHPRYKRSPFVFPGRKGNQRTDIHHQVNEIKTSAGIPKTFRALHGLRHVYASMLASSGEVDLYTLQKLMTHKHPRMTQRYAHLRDDAMHKASALAGSIIEEAAANKDDDEGKIVNLEDRK